MTMNTTPKTPLWRDDRFWKIALQVIVLIAVLSLFTLLGTNLSRNLQQTGGTVFNFNFLNSTAGFGIGESLIPYQPTDNYSQVLLAGLINSLRVMFFGMILTTLLGVTAGITYFSDNWLLRQMTICYVEVVRNTPLLLQLMFWYGIFLKLPSIEQTAQFLNFIYLNQRGVFVPWPSGNAVWFWLAVLLISAIASILIWRWRTKIMVEQGKSGQPQLTLLWIIGIAAIFIIIFGLGWQRPIPSENARTIEGGLRMTIEFTTLLVGLVVYTGAYIAEIVRSGIQSVAKGQWEAARSLGLRPGLVMRLVVFPQALRVIIPPLNSQYLNLAKNSSLAIAVAYPDIYSVANTTFNQSGRVVEVMLIIMATYLTIDLLISIAMNGLNRAVQLRER
ncbi:ABC transporter permease subunit [Limnoraphis robusta]|uniref:ABC transporter permease subunit n=1 Tax=Limnoraphis robusta CCNP1315 TaxID=3110306 RepID=A0ABU5TUI1_9CYAN|nr:ABC transporter permease subunit [Limnoraphis robusta]MEA5518561.1 ABC transporter permease subunit [Limnoraphis robusta CCNP1315]MEA5548604.1 ABC transporter permease subunit [Limnoraphis robusta CCNP1324]